MAAVGMTFGFMTMLLAGAGSNFLGLPPGERDDAYLRAAPEEALIYFEWASRGEGKAGGEGIDGLVADPEVQYFFGELRNAIYEAIERDTSRSAAVEEQTIGKHLPPLVEHIIGHSGCLYVEFSNPNGQPPADGEGDETERGPPADGGGDQRMAFVSGAKATLIFDGGDTADDVEAHLIELLKLIPQGDGPGDSLDRFTIPLPVAGMKVTVHRENNHFIVTVCKDDSALERAIAGLKGDVEGLGSAEKFTQQWSRARMDRVGSVSWINIGRIRDQAVELAGFPGAMAQQMIDTVGAGNVESLISVQGVIDGQIAGRTHLETGGTTSGIFALAGGRALKPEDFAAIPADADLAVSFTLDLPLLVAAVEGIVKSVDPNLGENLEQMKTMFAEQTGIELEEQLLAAYGQQWSLFDSPAAGGVFATSLILSLEVEDAETARAVYDKSMQLFRSELPGDFGNESRRRAVTLESREFLDRTIHYVNTIGDDDVPVAPAFCQTDSHLLIALHPQALKGYLRHLKSEGPSLADEFTEHAPEGAETICYTQFDTPKLVSYLYAFVPYVAQIALSEAQSRHFNLDLFAVPSAAAVLPYLKESRSWIVRTEDGLLFESRSSLPGVPLAGALMNFAFIGHRAQPAFQRIDEAVPAEPLEEF